MAKHGFWVSGTTMSLFSKNLWYKGTPEGLDISVRKGISQCTKFRARSESMLRAHVSVHL